jgi:hypothetical protein
MRALEPSLCIFLVQLGTQNDLTDGCPSGADFVDREGWLFELKWDGFRAIAESDTARKVQLSSRNHN